MKNMNRIALIVTSVLSLTTGCLFIAGCVTDKTQHTCLNDLQQRYWNELKIRLDQPAQQWDHAFPVGNGRLGAMVFGTVPQKHLQLNEDTLWSGGPHNYNVEGAYEHLGTVRQLIFQGKPGLAEDVIGAKMMGNPRKLQTYQPFADLYLQFTGHENFTEYTRTLDLDQAVTTVRYKVGDVSYTREIFASAADNVIVVNLT